MAREKTKKKKVSSATRVREGYFAFCSGHDRKGVKLNAADRRTAAAEMNFHDGDWKTRSEVTRGVLYVGRFDWQNWLVQPIKVGGKFEGWLVNGDRGVSTQQAVRRRAQLDVKNGVAKYALIVPRDALEGARINLSSIRGVQVEADSIEKIDHVFKTWAELPGGRRYDRSWRKPRKGEDDYSGTLSYYNVANNGRRQPKGPLPKVKPDKDGKFRYTETRHFLGAGLFTACYTGERKRRYFLSAFDEQERRFRGGLYFLCEVPDKVLSIAEAYEALKPVIVQKAELVGDPVVRQGDIFAVESSLDSDDLLGMGAKIQNGCPMHEHGPSSVLGYQLLDTSHVATDVARLPDGTTYVRGKLMHRPQLTRSGWSSPDHGNRPLGNGKTWWQVETNTVRRVGTDSQAWSSHGSVD